jgi:hypothetical protein
MYFSLFYVRSCIVVAFLGSNVNFEHLTQLVSTRFLHCIRFIVSAVCFLGFSPYIFVLEPVRDLSNVYMLIVVLTPCFLGFLHWIFRNCDSLTQPSFFELERLGF